MFLKTLVKGEAMVSMQHVILTSRPEKTSEIKAFRLYRLQAFSSHDTDTFIDAYCVHMGLAQEKTISCKILLAPIATESFKRLC
jgi:hypothetical protein